MYKKYNKLKDQYMEIEVNHNHDIISIFVAFEFDWTGLQSFQLTKNMQVSIRGYSECCVRFLLENIIFRIHFLKFITVIITLINFFS